MWIYASISRMTVPPKSVSFSFRPLCRNHSQVLVHPQQVQDSRVKIPHRIPFAHSPQPHLVGLRLRLPQAHPAAREPHRETVRIVIPPVAPLRHRQPPELRAPDYQG